MLELDHVVIAAADLEAAAVVLEERYGSGRQGREPSVGVSQRIPPTGARALCLPAL
jgi:hypothetical protein